MHVWKSCQRPRVPLGSNMGFPPQLWGTALRLTCRLSGGQTPHAGAAWPLGLGVGIRPGEAGSGQEALASRVHAHRQCARQLPKRDWDTVGGGVHSEGQCGIVLPASGAECSLLVAAKRLAARTTGWPALTLPQPALCGLQGSWERGAAGGRREPEVAFRRPRRHGRLGPHPTDEPPAVTETTARGSISAPGSVRGPSEARAADLHTAVT